MYRSPMRVCRECGPGSYVVIKEQIKKEVGDPSELVLGEVGLRGIQHGHTVSVIWTMFHFQMLMQRTTVVSCDAWPTGLWGTGNSSLGPVCKWFHDVTQVHGNVRFEGLYRSQHSVL